MIRGSWPHRLDFHVESRDRAINAPISLPHRFLQKASRLCVNSVARQRMCACVLAQQCAIGHRSSASEELILAGRQAKSEVGLSLVILRPLAALRDASPARASHTQCEAGPLLVVDVSNAIAVLIKQRHAILASRHGVVPTVGLLPMAGRSRGLTARLPAASTATRRLAELARFFEPIWQGV